MKDTHSRTTGSILATITDDNDGQDLDQKADKRDILASSNCVLVSIEATTADGGDANGSTVDVEAAVVPIFSMNLECGLSSGELDGQFEAR